MYNEYNLGFDDFDIVEEGFFCENTEHTVRDLLASIRTNVREKYNTAAAAHELFDKISDEIVSFNELLLEMINARRDYKAGNISKEDMLAVIIPSIKELKSGCTALQLVPSSSFGEGDDITEEEVAAIKELLVGCRTIVEERIQELENYPGTDWEGKAGTIMHGSEGFLESIFEEDDYAIEGIIPNRTKQSMAIRHSTDAKLATKYFKQAKKLYSLGEKENAISTLKKAKGLYIKCLKAAKNIRGGKQVDRTQRVGFGTKDNYKDNTYYNPILVHYFEDRIDACDALALQWSNKAGKSTYKETKALLKEERREARANKKESKRAAREAKRAAKESYDYLGYFDDDMDLYAFESDFDDYDSYDEYLADIAIENAVNMLLIEDGFGDEF